VAAASPRSQEAGAGCSNDAAVTKACATSRTTLHTPRASPVLELWKGTTEVVGRCLAAFADKARTRSRGASPTEASGREPLGEHLGVEGEHDVIARPVSDDQLGDLR
jgi:hypothetical protein